ncbi:MAG: hypothetical protein MUF69_07170, partial [Desulfobacterota bacterium]|nr:hypothetical protein [Thermodesulfobacteriota bacterium]
MKKTIQAVCFGLLVVLFLSVPSLQAQKDKEKPLDTVKPSLNPQRPPQTPPPQALPDLIVERIVLGPECRVDVVVANRGPGAVPDTVWTAHTPLSSSVYIHVDGNSWG